MEGNSSIAYNHFIPLVCLFWDYQNIPNKNLASYIINFGKSQGKLIKPFIYDNWEKKPQDKRFFESQGFECKQVSNSHKNAADNKLLLDIGKELEKKNTGIFILVTGDHFALDAIEEIHANAKKGIVISLLKNCCEELKKQADEFYSVQEIIEKFSTKTNEPQPYLNYHKAVYYLIKAIKTCLAKRKPSIQQRVESLMRNILQISKLQILKPDGTKFSKFCEFLDTVIQDDIITIRNEELFLL